MTQPDSRKVISVRFDCVDDLERAYQQQISKGGYFIASDEPQPRTTPVVIHFELPGMADPLAIEAEVAFAATPEAPMPGMGAGMALQFTQLSDKIGSAFEVAITVAKSEGMGDPKPEPAASGEEDEDDQDGALDEDSETGVKRGKDLMSRLGSAAGEHLYFELRKLKLHEKIVVAKRGNRSMRAVLLQEGNKKVMLFLLQNPQLGMSEILQMLKMPNLSIDVIQQISKNSAFNQSEEVKYRIVINPRTPLPLSLKLVKTLNVKNIAQIAKSGASHARLKSTALKLLEQRRK